MIILWVRFSLGGESYCVPVDSEEFLTYRDQRKHQEFSRTLKYFLFEKDFIDPDDINMIAHISVDRPSENEISEWLIHYTALAKSINAHVKAIATDLEENFPNFYKNEVEQVNYNLD